MGRLTRGELSPEEVSLVCEKVLDEADGDHDGRLSLEDFQNMILRAPDFLRCLTPLGASTPGDPKPWAGPRRISCAVYSMVVRWPVQAGWGGGKSLTSGESEGKKSTEIWVSVSERSARTDMKD